MGRRWGYGEFDQSDMNEDLRDKWMFIMTE